MNRTPISAIAWALLGSACAKTPEPPRALTERELGNVTAFANALGYVRFFHPTDAAARVNWDAFAVRGIRVVESATSADSLASALRSVFAPITSNVRFVRTGAPLPTTIPKPADATHVVFWRHLGVGVPSGAAAAPHSSGVYQSERVVASLSEIGRPVAVPSEDSVTASPPPTPRELVFAALAETGRPVAVPSKDSVTVSLPPVPDPSHPMIAALGGGVSMSMPIGLFTQSDVVDESVRRPNPSGVWERFGLADRATRLADVALAWSLFEHFYPYFDVADTDWPAALDAALRSAATDVDGDAFQATLERLLAALHDGHGFIRHKSRPPTPDARFGWAEGHVLVTAIGDSARASGLTIGDEVIAVDRRPIETVLAERSTRVSGATPQAIRSLTLDYLVAAPFCSGRCVPSARAELRIHTASGATRDISVSRAPTVAVHVNVDSITEVSPGVLYLDVGRLTEADVDSAMPRLRRANAVIVDMRASHRTPYATGGRVKADPVKLFAHLSDTPIYSPRFLIPVITLPNYQNVGFLDRSGSWAPAAPRLTARLIVLSDGGDISGEESVLGMVEENRLGDIVGEPSAGTNGVVNPFMLPGGYTLYWTGMLVRKRDGTQHHGVGVIPTVPVSPTVAGIRAGRDEILERAISLATAHIAP